MVESHQIKVHQTITIGMYCFANGMSSAFYSLFKDILKFSLKKSGAHLKCVFLRATDFGKSNLCQVKFSLQTKTQSKTKKILSYI